MNTEKSVLILEGQKINQRLGFIGLAKQNSELIALNKELSQLSHN